MDYCSVQSTQTRGCGRSGDVKVISHYGHKGVHAEELFDALYGDHVVKWEAEERVVFQKDQRLATAPKLVTTGNYVVGDWLTDREWLHQQLGEMDHRAAADPRATTTAASLSQAETTQRRASLRGGSLGRASSAGQTNGARSKHTMSLFSSSGRGDSVTNLARFATSAQRAVTERLASKRHECPEARSLASRAALLKLPEMRSVMAKCGAAATTFHKSSQGTYDKALAREKMTPTILETFLRHNFNLRLSPRELGALFSWMDTDGNRAIEATEFLREFWKFGQVEKMRISAENRRRAQRLRRRDELLHTNWMLRFASSAPVRVAGTFSDADLKDAEAALANAAADTIFEPIHRQMFDGPALGPDAFAEMIKRLFNITFKPAQLAALMYTYDRDHDGRVDGGEFYKAFTRLGRRERQRRFDAAARGAQVRQKRAEVRERRAIVRLGGIPKEAKVIWPEAEVIVGSENDLGESDSDLEGSLGDSIIAPRHHFA